MRAPSRIDRSLIGRWFWSVDRVTLGLVGAIALIGLVVLLAAGPASAQRLGISESFHFPLRQLVFLGPAAAIMFGVSLLSPLQARRVGVVAFLLALCMMALALFLAPEINGARRWFALGPFAFQPSEFAKPGFTLVAAWMLAEGVRNPRFPGAAIAAALYAGLIALLVAQPDYGQAALVTAVWMMMFFVVGWNWAWIAVVGLAGAAALGLGYFVSPHLSRRIDAFLNPDAAETYQVDKALEAIANGGLFGRSGEGAAVKLQLPDAHSDFIFAVAGEEGGFLLGFVIIALFAALTARLLARAASLKSVFAQCAVSGLAAQLGLQALINISVSLRAVPAKGMTLPLISYGGSSLIAAGLTLGLVLALTRTSGVERSRREFMP